MSMSMTTPAEWQARFEEAWAILNRGEPIDVAVDVVEAPVERPAVTLDDFIGQARTKRLIDVELNLALTNGTAFPHMLLTGPPGSGKTTLARAIADALGDPLTVVARPLRNPVELAAILDENAGGTQVLMIDEAHCQPKNIKDALLTLMWEQYIDHPNFGRMTFEGVTVIAATTEREQIDKALQSRFGLQPLFEPYTDVEMAAIVAQMAARAQVELDVEQMLALARASGGVPRQASHLVDRTRALAATGEVDVAEVLLLAGVEADGLTEQHLLYLRYLLELGGTAGVGTLATRLRLHQREVVDLERLLLDRGLIRLTKQGRVATGQARQRLGGGRPARRRGGERVIS